ncbi:unnamed protein product [Oppiella nova]|uniref:Uncharacterized protein n=1 Tax=Oppiella nova TaxID=334625 RepID=A0A7R9MPS8_9ACAR|nr:unnamed protein product [Oppiella nova]CAG2181168.1 unnamed protein product [Oppiella nova]
MKTVRLITSPITTPTMMRTRTTIGPTIDIIIYIYII